MERRKFLCHAIPKRKFLQCLPKFLFYGVTELPTRILVCLFRPNYVDIINIASYQSLTMLRRRTENQDGRLEPLPPHYHTIIFAYICKRHTAAWNQFNMVSCSISKAIMTPARNLCRRMMPDFPFLFAILWIALFIYSYLIKVYDLSDTIYFDLTWEERWLILWKQVQFSTSRWSFAPI